MRLLIALFLAFSCAAQQRIVSTAPSSTETLYAMGLGDRVVGVSQYSHYPPDARRKPQVGSYIRPDIETILSLRPDLVVIQKVPGQLRQQLERVGLRVVEVDHGNLEQTLDSFLVIGRAADATTAAQALVKRTRDRLDEIRRKTAKPPKRSALFIVGRTPQRIAGMVAVGKGSYLNDLFEIAGGANVFADALVAYPKVSLEEVLARNPDVILDMGDMSDTEGVSEEHKRSVVALWKQYPSLRAVREHRVFAVASDIYVVPGPRMVDAAEAFARMLHPEVGW